MSNTMANSFSRLLSDPHAIMAAQHWEQPTDITQAKDLLSRLRSSITRRARAKFFHPKSKMQSILLLTCTVWSKMEQETLDNLITCGRPNAAHGCLVITLRESTANPTRHASTARKLASPLPELWSSPNIQLTSRKMHFSCGSTNVSPSTTRTFFMKGSSRSCVTGSANRATFSPCTTVHRASITVISMSDSN